MAVTKYGSAPKVRPRQFRRRRITHHTRAMRRLMKADHHKEKRRDINIAET
jgi:hypothetical protein